MKLDYSQRPRITSLRAKNFRSLGNVTVNFGNLTVFAGPNGAGKSNVCKALKFISDSLKMGLEAAIIRQGGFDALQLWDGRGDRDIQLEVTVELPNQTDDPANQSRKSTGIYSFVIKRSSAGGYFVGEEAAQVRRFDTFGIEAYSIVDGLWDGPEDLHPHISQENLLLPLLGGDPRFYLLAQSLKEIVIYNISLRMLTAPQSPSAVNPMREDGSNWAFVLKELVSGQRKGDLLAAMERIAGDIDGCRVEHVSKLLLAEFRHGTTLAKSTLGLEEEVECWHPVWLESEGTLRTAGILTALLQEQPPILMGFEEPETAVHPAILPLLHDYLDEATLRGQILITTHSPDLLDLVDAESVRVVERHGGITTVAPMDETQRRIVHDRLANPGELLRMQGLRQEIASDRET